MTPTRLRSCWFFALAFSTWACTHHDPPAPTPTPNTCSYTLDGRSATGTAKASRTPYRIYDTTGDHPAEMLTITCTSTPTSPAASLTFSINFIKFQTESDEAFRPLLYPSIDVLQYNPVTSSSYTNYTPAVLTLQTTSNGGFSGTFAGTYLATATAPKSVFTAGVFTDVHP